MRFKKMLIAVDGSENSIRAISYVGEVVGPAPGWSFNLLYIEKLPQRDIYPDDDTWKEECLKHSSEMKDFLMDARTILEAKGIASEAITETYITSCHSPLAEGSAIRCSPGTSIALEIMERAREEGYGTLVVGRRGISKSEAFLFGSVSNKIIHHAKDCSVWVVS